MASSRKKDMSVSMEVADGVWNDWDWNRTLRDLLHARGDPRGRERNPAAEDSTSESIRRMEIVLSESDKILEHWKR